MKKEDESVGVKPGWAPRYVCTRLSRMTHIHTHIYGQSPGWSTWTLLISPLVKNYIQNSYIRISLFLRPLSSVSIQSEHFHSAWFTSQYLMKVAHSCSSYRPKTQIPPQLFNLLNFTQSRSELYFATLRFLRSVFLDSRQFRNFTSNRATWRLTFHAAESNTGVARGRGRGGGEGWERDLDELQSVRTDNVTGTNDLSSAWLRVPSRDWSIVIVYSSPYLSRLCFCGWYHNAWTSVVAMTTPRHVYVLPAYVHIYTVGQKKESLCDASRSCIASNYGEEEELTIPRGCLKEKKFLGIRAEFFRR